MFEAEKETSKAITFGVSPLFVIAAAHQAFFSVLNLSLDSDALMWIVLLSDRETICGAYSNEATNIATTNNNKEEK